jgi:hypothetical protein
LLVLKTVFAVLVATFVFSGVLPAATTATKAVSSQNGASGKKAVSAHNAVPKRLSGQAVTSPRPKASAKVASQSKTGTRRAASSASRRRTSSQTATRSRTGARATGVVRRPTQQVPTPDRYRAIQQALADKGYFQGTVDGNWKGDSVDALKRFQKDQNLTDTGKLDSLSLIALGLGPKRSLSAGSTTESRPQDDHRRPEGSERP